MAILAVVLGGLAVAVGLRPAIHLGAAAIAAMCLGCIAAALRHDAPAPHARTLRPDP